MLKDVFFFSMMNWAVIGSYCDVIYTSFLRVAFRVPPSFFLSAFREAAYDSLFFISFDIIYLSKGLRWKPAWRSYRSSSFGLVLCCYITNKTKIERKMNSVFFLIFLLLQISIKSVLQLKFVSFYYWIYMESRESRWAERKVGHIR